MKQFLIIFVIVSLIDYLFPAFGQALFAAAVIIFITMLAASWCNQKKNN